MKREFEKKINNGFTISNSRNTMLDLINSSRDSHVFMGGNRGFSTMQCDTVEVWVNKMCDSHENTIKLLEEELKNQSDTLGLVELMIESLEVDMNYGDSKLAKTRLKQLTKILKTITR
jgi:leucyl-tRNA synthetase